MRRGPHETCCGRRARLIKEVQRRRQRRLQGQQQRERGQRLLAAAQRPKHPPAVLIRPAMLSKASARCDGARLKMLEEQGMGS